jgi:hypothetical protein
LGSYLKEKVAAPVKKTKTAAVGIRHADHPLSANLALTSPTSDGRSVGRVRSRTQATKFSFFSLVRNKFRHHSYISHKSHDDDLYVPKNVVSKKLKTCVRAKLTPSLLFAKYAF